MRRTTPARGLSAVAVLLVAVVSLGFRAAPAEARGWLGVYSQSITRELRDGLDLRGEGVLVNGVVANSPADRAGVRKGDVITSFNSRSVDSPEALTRMVGDADEGRSVALGILRNGERRTLSVTLGNRPDEGDLDSRPDADSRDHEDMDDAPQAPETPEAPEAPTPPVPPRMHEHGAPEVRTFRFHGSPDEVHEQMRKQMGDMPDMRGMFGQDGNGLTILRNMGRGRLGVRVESLNDDLGSALGVENGHGVLIVDVVKDSPAERAGLKAGDVLTAVEGHSVSSTEELVNALRDQDGKVSLSVTRRGSRRTVEAELEDTPGTMRMRGGDESTGPGRMREDRRETRSRVDGDAERDELRQQIEQLRQQVRELRQQLEDRHR